MEMGPACQLFAGSGGFGVAYRAKWKEKDVVLKALHEVPTSNADKKRMLNAVRLLS